MKKDAILNFIDKYSLNGTIDRCRWISSSDTKTLKVSSSASSKNLLSIVTMSNWEGFGNAEIGVGDTKQLKNRIESMYNDDINLQLTYNEDKTRIVSLDISDEGQTNIYPTCDLDVIPQSSNMKKQVQNDVEIILDSETIERFLKIKKSLVDVNTFAVLMNKSNVLENIVGYSNNNTNRSLLKVKTNPGKDSIQNVLFFDARHLYEILRSNSDCGETILCVSNSGLASIEFKKDDFECKYFLVNVINN